MRLVVVFLLLLLSVLGLAGRLFWLQLVQGDVLAQQARSRQAPATKLLTVRWPVVDRQGDVLAWDEMRARIWAHPVYFQFPGDRDDQRRSAAEVSQRLAPVLNRSAAELEQRLSGQVGSIRLLEHLSLEKGELVKALGISGIDVEIYPQRRYPQGELFANVVGFLNLERQPQAGLELSRNAQLRQGEPSPRLLEGGDTAVLPVNLSMGAITDDAMQLQLSLDARLQRAAYTALAAAMEQWTAARGAVMVMDVQNGELLALASQPSFDPSRFWQADPRHFRGWPVEDLYEPGSTFKPINLAIALEEGLIYDNSTVHDTGSVVVESWTLHNNQGQVHGVITMPQVLQVSSNVGMVKTMLRLSRERYWQWLHKLEIEQAPDTDLPGATAGQLKSLQVFRSNPIHAATASFGQGIALTPLKLLQLHAALANGGWLVRPHVVQGLRNRDAMVATPPLPQRKRIFQEASTATVRNWMASAARLAQAPGAGMHLHPVAGKTGTSQKARLGGYDPDAVTTSFVAHLPTDQPRFVVLAVVDEPRGEETYGATVALPVAYRVIDSITDLDNLLPAHGAAS
ncbi:MAG: penicillin-binding protein 2 [Synechococcus sp. SB0676_bin_10]|uniref:Penicillin-binding protein 2 n=1 Tax=Synechococcus sp. SB0676_bin_10 TaxID=2604869 RepID=A0A6B1FE75_9SYNE|nr:penicillin-binding protein 2 [Synechococcus sp. SB0676_bin_10]MYK06815.1 penicillin-binding protein 2 [Synechococcus sp. SB0670_bin_20]